MTVNHDEIRHLIEPHILLLAEDLAAGRGAPMYCHEGTNHCGGDVIVWGLDDIVFIREIDSGAVVFQPSHRACAEAEWGTDHLVPEHRFDPTPATHSGWPG